MDFKDPKLAGMVQKVSSFMTNPMNVPNPPNVAGETYQTRALPPLLNYTAQQPSNVTQLFQQTSDHVTRDSKKKQLTIAGICAGVVFVFCFVFLCSLKPGFIMKKKHDDIMEKQCVNFVSVFVISIILAVIVMIVGLVTVFKK